MNPITAAPSWLLDLVRSETRGRGRPVQGLTARSALQGAASPTRTVDANLPPGQQLEEWTAIVRAAEEGNRNSKLNLAAYCLRRLVTAGCLERDGVVTALSDAAEEAGLEEDESRRTINSGLDAKLDRRPVLITTLQHEVNAQVLDALALDEELYSREGRLVYVARQDDGTPRIASLDKAQLRPRMTKFVDFVKGKNGGVPAHPPDWCVDAVLAQQNYEGLRPLAGISPTPVLRRDGSIFSTPGYDAITKTLFQPSAPVDPIPERPSPSEVSAAVELLLEPFRDFPFRDKVADRAALVSGILSIVGRPAIDGQIPALIISSPVRGSGKSLAAEVMVTAATGSTPAMMSPPETTDEWAKLLLGLALEGPRAVVFDNVVGRFGSGPLASLITAGRFAGRVLSKNMTASASFAGLVIATGNNVVLTSDLDRRILLCEIDAESESPEDRGAFTHQLPQYVQQHWSSMVAAALIVLRAFIQAGRPRHSGRRLGSFFAWDDLVRSACIWSGIGDPDGNRERIRSEVDDTVGALAALLVAWKAVFGADQKTAAEAVQKARASTQLREAILGVVTRGGRELEAHQVGIALRANKDRVVNGMRMRAIAGRSNGSKRWFVEEVGGGRG